jgi:hypothetical protein
VWAAIFAALARVSPATPGREEIAATISAASPPRLDLVDQILQGRAGAGQQHRQPHGTLQRCLRRGGVRSHGGMILAAQRKIVRR